MTDINRDDTKIQPPTIPVLGTPTGTYTAPGEDWDGEPVRVPLDDAAEAVGLVPNTDFEIERFNDIAGRLGQALSTIVDMAAINLSPVEYAVGDAPSFSGMGNSLRTEPFVAPGMWYSGQEREILCAFNSTGLQTSKDGRLWESQGSVGFGEALDDATAGHYLFAGDNVDYVTIVAYSEEGDGEFRASDNFGTSWYDAGFLPARL
jgi:hypothetical protein